MSVGTSADAQLGIPVERSAYPEGEDGIQRSLSRIAQKIREGYSTAAMKSFAGNVLKQMGWPKTSGDGIRARCEALLDWVRAHVTYAPDAPATEQIQAAAITLCVDGAPICIPIGDCDDLVTALGTLVMAAGMYPLNVIRQFFGHDLQQHVLIEVQDENGRWIPLDPSTKYPAGKKASAVRETRIDPLQGVEGAQFVGIGGLPVMEYNEKQGWHELNEKTGLGALGDCNKPPVAWLPHGDSPEPTFHPPKHTPKPNFPCVPAVDAGAANPNPRAFGPPEAKGDSRWYRVDSQFAAYPLVPEQVTFYANDWYFKDANGAIYKYACCDDCGHGRPCSGCGDAGVARGGGGGGGHGGGGGGHGGGGGGHAVSHAAPAHGGAPPSAFHSVPAHPAPFHHGHPGHFGHHRLRRFFGGRWWGWDGYNWYVVAAPTCAWGPPLVNPPADLYAEAASQVAAQGPGVIEVWTDGLTYLFGAGPTIYPCIGGLYGGAARLPFG